MLTRTGECANFVLKLLLLPANVCSMWKLSTQRAIISTSAQSVRKSLVRNQAYIRTNHECIRAKGTTCAPSVRKHLVWNAYYRCILRTFMLQAKTSCVTCATKVSESKDFYSSTSTLSTWTRETMSASSVRKPSKPAACWSDILKQSTKDWSIKPRICSSKKIERSIPQKA